MGLGESGDEWHVQRIGTSAEKSSVEKELAELRERMTKVEEWKRRRQEIEDELNRVWMSGGEELPPPVYAEKDEDTNKPAEREPKGVRILEDSHDSVLSAGSTTSL
jgi:ATP-binding cassette, subfamily D (ALD), peroxisomal long-chain fatty acid import protein